MKRWDRLRSFGSITDTGGTIFDDGDTGFSCTVLMLTDMQIEC